MELRTGPGAKGAGEGGLLRGVPQGQSAGMQAGNAERLALGISRSRVQNRFGSGESMVRTAGGT